MDEEINLGEISIDEDQIQIPSINIPLIKGDKGDTGAKGEDGQDYVITSSDYQAIADIVENDITIPTKLSDLDNDEGFIDNTVNDLENYTKTSDLSSVATSGSYNDLSNTPSIPSKTSDLTNDSGFIDKNVNNLTNYYTKSETYTKTEVDNKGYITKDVNNLTNYYKTSETYNKTQTDTLLNGKQDTLESGTNIKTINNQSILGSGNITIQGGGGTSDYTDLTNKPSINNVTLSGNKTTSDLGLGTYSKPSNGIPKTDLASDVQTSLGKADTAIQSSDLTNYVTNTDYATTEKGGTIRTSNASGLGISNGNLYAVTKAYNTYNSASNNMFISKGTLENVITGKNLETSNNKVTSISSSSTNTEYPSAKAVYDYIQSLNGDEVSY